MGNRWGRGLEHRACSKHGAAATYSEDGAYCACRHAVTACECRPTSSTPQHACSCAATHTQKRTRTPPTGVEGPWSEPAQWLQGLMTHADWVGGAVSGPAAAGGVATTEPASPAAAPCWVRHPSPSAASFSQAVLERSRCGGSQAESGETKVGDPLLLPPAKLFAKAFHLAGSGGSGAGMGSTDAGGAAGVRRATLYCTARVGGAVGCGETPVEVSTTQHRH